MIQLLLDAWYNFDPFNDLYDFIADHLGDEAVYVISAVISATAILSFVGLGALANVWLERRIIGRIQVRRGPNRVGLWGLLQPVADAIKLIQKEVLQPRVSDRMLFNLPPILVFIPAMLTFAVFAWAPDLVYADLNVGVLYLLALSSITSIAIFIAGWASNNKYALLGAMRIIAMAISYEVPMVLALLAPVLFAGTMSIPGIIDWQRQYDAWLAFLLPLPVFIYAISATAELNRTPADIAEAESEIVAGFHTEYSGMKFGLFYAVELINSLAVSGIMASLFFGGYSLYGADNYIPPWIIFIGKMYFFYFGLIWLRGTWPRLRIDQLMAFAWKMLIPLALINLVIVATEVLIWREFELGNWVLAVYAVINFILALLLLGFFF
ncbi:MAG: NADH-quinone oxidoreductase subunit NuoH, partial [Dehalococcoidia bacterium]|nr:NADH-quinone oxidoreductase subunit NuoH [Dehalococcoidia bacterium]